jgi:hypothetical protein
MKQYVGISRDHSGSMASLAGSAMVDYNDNINAIRKAALQNDIDTIVTTARCGIGGGVDFECVNSSVSALKPITKYEADGMTPLFDSVGELIASLEKVPDANDPAVSFLVMAITDGEENASKTYKAKLGQLLRQKQASDRWTFVFRVPRGYGRNLEALGIPSGNIQEWDQTVRGIKESSVATQKAVTNYYSARRNTGLRSTDAFYTNLAGVTPRQIKKVMTDISNEVKIWPVSQTQDIRDFVENKMKFLQIGTAFYQLTKKEKVVQSNKLICIRDKGTGAVYAGQAARDLLALPATGTVSLTPGDHGNYDIFIQSLSTNRKLLPGSNVMYWKGATLL